jgi:type IV fimbrial biogenesis protein FimT
MRQQRQKAFTLIELMVVLLIMGVLTAAALPSFRQTLISNRISSTASDFVVDLTVARATATTRGVRVGICASSNQSTCTGSWEQGWMMYLDANNNNAFDAGETIVRVRYAIDSLAPAQGGMSLVPTVAATNIYFRPSGPADAAHTFNICKSGFTGRKIDVTAVGRVSSVPTAAVCP